MRLKNGRLSKEDRATLSQKIMAELHPDPCRNCGGAFEPELYLTGTGMRYWRCQGCSMLNFTRELRDARVRALLKKWIDETPSAPPKEKNSKKKVEPSFEVTGVVWGGFEDSDGYKSPPEMREEVYDFLQEYPAAIQTMTTAYIGHTLMQPGGKAKLLAELPKRDKTPGPDPKPKPAPVKGTYCVRCNKELGYGTMLFNQTPICGTCQRHETDNARGKQLLSEVLAAALPTDLF